MTRLKQISILLLSALILTLGNPQPSGVLAAQRQTAASPSTSRFVVFESFLRAT